MIKFKIKHGWFKKSYIEIPSSYEDLTVRQFLTIQEMTDETEIIKIITGLDIQNFEKIYVYFGWLKTKLDLSVYQESNYLNVKGRIILVPEIKSEEFGKKITYLRLLKKKETSILKYVTCYLDVTELELMDLSYIDVYCVWLNLNRQFTKLLKDEEKIPKVPLDDKMKLAGIEDFNILGDFNSVIMIAKMLSKKIEDVYKIKYETVYLILYHSNLNAKFEKKYREILNPKT